jgi:enoyl-CoA hydratase
MKTQTLAQGRALIEWREDGIARFTVCRPKVHNALDLDTIDALDHFLTALERKPEITFVILAGAGDEAFIAGGDLRQLAQMRGAEAGAAFSRRVGELLLRLEGLGAITAAAIGGDAYGGGCELALACDLRLIEEGSALIFSQARFGLTSGWGGMLRLTRLVGYSRALELFLRQRRVGAQEALGLGLANEVVPRGQAVEAALALGAEVNALGPEVALGLKRVAQFAVMSDPEDALAEERKVFSGLWASTRREALMRAFLNKERG